MYSQGPLQGGTGESGQGMRCDDESRGGSHAWSQSELPLESGEDREMPSPLEPPGKQPCQPSLYFLPPAC